MLWELGRVDLQVLFLDTETLLVWKIGRSMHLLNNLTQSLFDPKSFEPNFKQTAVQLHSQKVPAGIEMQQDEIAGELAYEKIKESERELSKDKQQILT